MRNGNFLKIRVSEIRVKRIRVNQGLGVYQFRLPNLLPASSRKLATVSVVQFIFQLVNNFHSSFMVVCAIYCYAHYVNGQKLIHAK